MTLPNNSHLTTTSLHLASSYLLPGRIRVRPQLRACSVQVKRATILLHAADVEAEEGRPGRRPTQRARIPVACRPRFADRLDLFSLPPARLDFSLC